MIERLRTFHRTTSVVVGLAVPVAIFLINGTLAPWAFVLGAAIGLGYWYFGPLGPPF